VKVGTLPVILARRSQMIMLFEELLMNGIRAGITTDVPEISIKAARDPEGNPIIVFEEKSAPLSLRKKTLKTQFEDLQTPETDARTDPHRWSLCQRLVEKNNGQFRIAKHSGDGTRIMIRFPKHMIA
jgi:two-component sensor histidine kinase